MVRISRYRVSDKVYDNMLTLLFHVVGERRNKEEFLRTIFDLLTQAERLVISKRILLMYLIMKKIDYREICQVLKVSNNTISRYRPIVEKSEGIVPLLKEILTRERIGDFIEELIVEFFPPGRYGTNWKAAWDLKIKVERKKITGI